MYSQTIPPWGANPPLSQPQPPQFQLGQPPSYQPMPSWGGMDYYRAHSAGLNADPSFFDHAWDRVRHHRDYTEDDAMAVGIHEAQHWHHRAYEELGALTQMDPAQIGHAAAYEVYRTRMSSHTEGFFDDFDRQRENVIGMAVGEAGRLLHFTQRPIDHYARMAASEAAAATASMIFYWSRQHDEEPFRGRSRSRRGSFSDYGDVYGDTYGPYSVTHRSSSRHRSHSRHRHEYPPPTMHAPSIGAMPYALDSASPSNALAFPPTMTRNEYPPPAIHAPPVNPIGPMPYALDGASPSNALAFPPTMTHGGPGSNLANPLPGSFGLSPNAYPPPDGAGPGMSYPPPMAMQGPASNPYVTSPSPMNMPPGGLGPYQGHVPYPHSLSGQQYPLISQASYPAPQSTYTTQYLAQAAGSPQYLMPVDQSPTTVVISEHRHHGKHRHRSRSRRSRSTDPRYIIPY